jgi:hypothetical protein
MRQAEWEILPKAVSLFCEGRIKIIAIKQKLFNFFEVRLWKLKTLQQSFNKFISGQRHHLANHPMAKTPLLLISLWAEA